MANNKQLTEKQAGLLRLRLRGILEPFNKYGLHVFVPAAIEAIVKTVNDLLLVEQ